jgi:hypothetical protein
VVLLLSPRADQAYAAAIGMATTMVFTIAVTAIIAFAVLPGLETFEALASPSVFTWYPPVL